MRGLALLVLLVLLAAPAAGLVNGPRPYEADHGFAPSVHSARVLVIGDTQVESPAIQGTQGYAQTTGFLVEGLERVCREPRSGLPLHEACEERPAGTLSIRLSTGGSVALRLPEESRAGYSSSSAIASFVDLADAPWTDAAEVDLQPSLVAFSDDGQVRLDLPVVPVTQEQRVPDADEARDRYGVLHTLGHAVLEVREGDEVLFAERGDGRTLVFQGSPVAAPFEARLAALPFQEGATAAFTPGGSHPGFARFEESLRRLGGEGAPSGFDELDAMFGPVLDGAVLGVPMDAQGRFTPEDLTLVRFRSLAVHSDGDGLAWTGRAALQVSGSDVVGASDLVGIGLFRMPWWSYVLWIMAIGLAVAVRVRRHSEAAADPKGIEGDASLDEAAPPPDDGPAPVGVQAPSEAVPAGAAPMQAVPAGAGTMHAAPSGAVPADAGAMPAAPAQAGSSQAADEGPTSPRAAPSQGLHVPRWAGWLLSLAGFVALFLLWDAEVASLWGTSILTSEAGGKALLVTAGLQMAPLLAGLFAAVAPMRWILRSGFTLSGHPGLKPVSGGIAYVAGFFLWATVLLAYIQMVLRAMVPLLAGAVG